MDTQHMENTAEYDFANIVRMSLLVLLYYFTV